MFAYFAVTAVTGFFSGVSAAIANSPSGNRAGRGVNVQPSMGSRWTIFDVVALATLISFSAFRFEVGTDYAVYALNYAQIQPEFWDYYLERSALDWGYTQLTIALRTLSDFPYLIFWVTSAITIVPVYLAIKKQSLNPALALILYVLLAFYLAPMNAIRQGMAVGLNFWASTFLEKRPWVFVALNIVASTLHLSAALAAVVQVVVKKWKPRTGGVLVALFTSLTFVLMMAFPPVRQFLASIIPRYELYLVPDAVGVGTYLALIFKLGILLYILHLLRNRPAEHIAMVAVGLVFLVVGTQYMVVARMEMYFGIFIVLALPNALAQTRAVTDRGKSLHVAAVVALAVAYFVAYLGNYAGLIPYKTYL